MINSSDKQTQLYEITQKYYDNIFKYIQYNVSNIEDACDLTQDVFADLIESFEKIDQKNIKKWLFTVAHNKIVDYYKRKKKNAPYTSHLDEYENSFELSYEIDVPVSENEIQKNIETVINILTPDEKELHKDYFLENMTYAELSEKHKISEGALRTRVSRLRYKLEKAVRQLLCMTLLCLTKIFLKMM